MKAKPATAYGFLDKAKYQQAEGIDHALDYSKIKVICKEIEYIERMKIIAECYDLIMDFFMGDQDKTYLWFTTKNPLLGNISPDDMIKIGRHKKLLALIKNQRDGNTP